MPIVLSFLPFYHTFGLHSFVFRYGTRVIWLSLADPLIGRCVFELLTSLCHVGAFLLHSN